MNVHFSSQNDEWKTPTDLLQNHIYKFAPIDLDPCCSDKHVKARRHYTETENGLKQPWEGVCFMNPPYGRQISAWCEKAADEADRGAVVIGLLPARVDTRWFHEQVFARAKAVVFVKGRLRFEGAPASAPFPSCLVLWANSDKDTEKFRNVFGGLGECMC